ncbi:MAG: hypothetical protein QOG09_1288 [Solirubrobacterales bacterium]|jgi:hypothetical protein|nr:hypothetical protein [Solirubrobacterales bacterium]MDX6663186.1 hypothetical protein [Solirubrobacterales bacterium]
MAKSTRARGAANAAGPYVQRLIEDDELRNTLRDAVHAARDAYGRVSNGKGPAKAMMEDKKVHRDLRTAAQSLRDASESLRGGRARKRHPLRKLLAVGILGGALALVVSEDLRKTVLDRLFGAEEEFEYTSSTTSADEVAA